MADHSAELDKLATAMAAAQAEMSVAVADSTNPHFKSRYADLGAIWGACREVLSKHGLSVIQCPGGEGSTAVLTSYLLHTSGQFIRTTAGVAVKDGAQPYGSALTYLRRYSLAALVGIVAEEDDDGERAQQPHRQQRSQPATKPANGHAQDEAAELAASALAEEFVGEYAEAKTMERWNELNAQVGAKSATFSDEQVRRIRTAAKFAKRDIAALSAEAGA
jgi:hypothetical protein